MIHRGRKNVFSQGRTRRHVSVASHDIKVSRFSQRCICLCFSCSEWKCLSAIPWRHMMEFAVNVRRLASSTPRPLYLLWKSTMVPIELEAESPKVGLDTGVKLRGPVPAGNLTIACYVTDWAMLVQLYLLETRSERLYSIFGAYSYATEKLNVKFV
jgi:hypothetical protein